MLCAGEARAIGEAFRGAAIDKSRFPEEVTDVYRRAFLEPGAATAAVNWYRALRYMPADWNALIQNPPVIETPTLMIWGEEDAALGKELTYGTDELVRDFTIHYVPNVSHWVQQEAPESVNAMLGAWLEKRADGA